MDNDGLFDSAKNVWEAWNVRVFILISLLVQTILILFGPLRKRTSNTLIAVLLWSAYLLADWAPKFGVGLIADNKRSAAGGDGDGSGSGTNQLGALWAQFLLLHLGGSDSITAYSLEDNQLWLSQLFGVTAQAVAAGYIFFQVLPGGNSQLLIPSIFVFIAGTIKCFERIRVAQLASEKNARESIMKQFPDVGGPTIKDKDDAQVSDLVSKFFIGMIVDLILVCNLDQYIEGASKVFFSYTSEQALQIIEVELNFIYEFFHTKIKLVISRLGMILRFTSFCSIVVALSVFYSQANSFNDAFDVGFTYTLFWATIALELISIGFILLSRAEKTKQVSMENKPLLWRKWSGSVSGLSWITYLVKARPLHVLAGSNQSKASASTRIIAEIIFLFGLHHIVDDIRIRTSLSHEPLPAELWKFIFNQIKAKADYVKNILPDDGYYPSEDQINQPYATSELNQTLQDMANRLQNFLVNWLQPHDRINDYIRFNDPVLERMVAKATAKREINSSRGDWVLGKWERELSPGDAAVKNIKEATGTFPGEPRMRFFQDVLIWHAATELLYSTDDSQVPDTKRFSKLLSDYMLYLLVVKPEMLNQVADNIGLALEESWLNVEHFGGNKPSLEPSEVKNACRKILDEHSTVDSVIFGSGRKLANCHEMGVLRSKPVRHLDNLVGMLLSKPLRFSIAKPRGSRNAKEKEKLASNVAKCGNCITQEKLTRELTSV